jgi:hypothetical protein
MSYKINKTDGVLLVDLVDGRIDTETTDLVFIGRNYTGYGELFNENFVKLLENFAAVSPPSKPLEGQLWYDKSDGRLKVWNGIQFRSTDTTVVSSVQPQLLAGDIWIDSSRQQMYFNDGLGTVLAGPIYTRNQGPTGFKVETINDRFGNPKTVAKLIVNSTELALISRETFEAGINQPGFGKNIKEGISISSNRPNFEFYGTASFARQLLDSTNQPFFPENFLKVNANNITTGTFRINNDSGLIVGRDVQFRTRMEIFPKIVVDEILDNNADYNLRVNRNNISTSAITVKTENRSVGIWTSSPDPNINLDVNGSVRITGDLIVEGTTTTLEVENLRIEDKLIELAATADSTIGGNVEVDGAGITVLSSDASKDWVWKNSSNSWTANTNIDVGPLNVYKIGGNTILSATELASTVTTASGITQVGALTSLDAANFNFSSSTMTVTDALVISSENDIIIDNSRKITNVGDPTNAQDVATKNYVDNEIANEPVFLEVDVTGINPVLINNHVKVILDTMFPWATIETPPSGNLVANPYRKNIGTKAIVHVIARTATVVTNPTLQTSKSFVAVDSGGEQNQSVVQDFSFTNQTNNIVFAVSLDAYRTFEFQTSVIGGEWQFLYDGVQFIP